MNAQIPNYEGNFIGGRAKFMSVFSTPSSPLSFHFTISSAVTTLQDFRHIFHIHIQYKTKQITVSLIFTWVCALIFYSSYFSFSTKEILKCKIKLGPKMWNNHKNPTPKHNLKTTHVYSLN